MNIKKILILIILFILLNSFIFSDENKHIYSLKEENYLGLKNSFRIKTKTFELLVPTEIGPRILHFSKLGKSNLFKVLNDQIEKKDSSNWINFGGHRLWRAPEDKVLTYSPENSKVNFEKFQNFIRISKIDSVNSLLKEIEIYPLTDDSIKILHKLTNLSKIKTKVSAWALTVFPLEGKVILPFSKRGTHPENLLASDSIHLWAYTDLSNPIFSFYKEFILMQKKENSILPQKIGVGGEVGFVAYILDDQVFVKSFKIFPHLAYPDKNSRVEIFINKKFVELESLSPLKILNENETISHTEIWHLFELEKNNISDEEIYKFVLEKMKN